MQVFPRSVKRASLAGMKHACVHRERVLCVCMRVKEREGCVCVHAHARTCVLCSLAGMCDKERGVGKSCYIPLQVLGWGELLNLFAEQTDIKHSEYARPGDAKMNQICSATEVLFYN